MNVKEYLGDIIGGSLMVAESRVIAGTLLQSLPEEEWKRLIIEQNILQKKSPQTAIRYARTIRWRLEPLGEAFIQELIAADERVCSQLLMLAVLINSPVLEDFIRHSVFEARRTYQPVLAMDAWDDFYQTRARAWPELAGYSESSIKKMGNNVIKILVDGGYLNTSRKRQLQPVYLLSETRAWLPRLQREDLAEVMECTL